jgi:hypothetical protein
VSFWVRGKKIVEAEKSTEGSVLFGCHPPMPQLALRVGISGHRPKLTKLPPESFAFVRRRLSEVFASVDAVLAGVVSKQGDYFSGDPTVRLVSGLAEGADQLAVAAMPQAWALDAVLPFPSEEYLKDFDVPPGGDREAVIAEYRACLQRPHTTATELPIELPSAQAANEARQQKEQVGEPRDAAYARLGGFLLRQIDVLVAVWDGRPEDGKGGTAEVVRAAVAANIPTVWIHSLNDTFGRMIEGIDDDGLVVAPAADCCKGPLREAIEAIVGFPADNAEALSIGDVEHISDRLRAYSAEIWPSHCCWIVYDAFKRGIGGKLPRLQVISENAEGYRARWAPAPEDDPAAGPLRDRLERLLLPRYAWADSLAVAYSHKYRSAYFICYLLAAFAVAIALCGIFVHDLLQQGSLNAKAILVLAELLVIGTIVRIVTLGRRARWKEKWIEYRSLAELLFNARFLSYLAEHGRAHRIGALNSSSPNWLLWYIRATVREIGLPPVLLDGTYQRAALGALDKHVVAPQCIWHSDNAIVLQRMHQILHRIGDSCFILTMIFLLAFLAVWSFTFAWGQLVDHFLADSIAHRLEEYATVLTFFAAGLPAFGAAIAGIRETGDFEKVAERSRKTSLALADLSHVIANARRSLTLDETGDTLLTAAQVLTEDLAAWQSVYGHKRLELPA